MTFSKKPWFAKINENENWSIISEDELDTDFPDSLAWVDSSDNAHHIVKCVNNYEKLEEENKMLKHLADNELTTAYLIGVEDLKAENKKLFKALESVAIQLTNSPTEDDVQCARGIARRAIHWSRQNDE